MSTPAAHETEAAMASMQSKTSNIRVAIVDDHALFRQGLQTLLSAEPDLQVIGEATNGIEAIALVRETGPDILLLDLAMPLLGGMEALSEIVNIQAHCRIILLTADIDRPQIIQALRCGARGVVTKHSACQLLCKAIRSVMAGQYWVCRDTVSDLVEYLNKQIAVGSTKERFGLTSRELQIVREVVEGSTNREVAQRFHLSEDTVKHHLSNVFDKLGVYNRLEMALYVVHHQLLEPTPASNEELTPRVQSCPRDQLRRQSDTAFGSGREVPADLDALRDAERDLLRRSGSDMRRRLRVGSRQQPQLGAGDPHL
jgi:two-component system, NarL family, nitrate/nitrite response regulator NarL